MTPGRYSQWGQATYVAPVGYFMFDWQSRILPFIEAGNVGSNLNYGIAYNKSDKVNNAFMRLNFAWTQCPSAARFAGLGKLLRRHNEQKLARILGRSRCRRHLLCSHVHYDPTRDKERPNWGPYIGMSETMIGSGVIFCGSQTDIRGRQGWN